MRVLNFTPGGAMRFPLLALAVTIMFLTPLRCAAGTVDLPQFSFSREWQSYKKVVAGGKYVFVMTRPISVEDETHGLSETASQEIRTIRRTYPHCGLYRNDGSTVPLWTIDWSEAEVDLASDGIHLVRREPWPLCDENQKVVSFFANGKLVRSYRLKDLIKYPNHLRRMAFDIEWCRDAKFDDSTLTYTINTTEFKRFVFDVTTGEIIQRLDWMRITSGVIFSISTGLLVLLLVAFRRRARRSSQKSNSERTLSSCKR